MVVKFERVYDRSESGDKTQFSSRARGRVMVRIQKGGGKKGGFRVGSEPYSEEGWEEELLNHRVERERDPLE